MTTYRHVRFAHYDLEVWQEAMDLVEQIYMLTEQFPSSERFNLIAQCQRSAVSVPSNIAEGAARGGNAEFVRFLKIARGSLMELDTQLHIALRLSYVSISKIPIEAIQKLSAKINRLIKHRLKKGGSP